MKKCNFTVSVDYDVFEQIAKEPNASQLINAQLVAYFNLAEKRAAKLQVQMEEEADKILRLQE
jgi:hypothetical protein